MTMFTIKRPSYVNVTRCLFWCILFLSSCNWSSADSAELYEYEVQPLSNRSIDDIFTPSDICKEIVGRFASAISNFTLCSVTNARPIHLCQWCVHQYLMVEQTHNDFTATIDEKGNPCKEYFTNLDRIEIVTDAYKYVKTLWIKGKCDYCFEKNGNGTIIPKATDDTVKFELFYEITKSCFARYLDTNETCEKCKDHYDELNKFYIKIGEKDGENICLDIVDTMNTTREIWSETFDCLPEWDMDIWLNVAMGVFAILIPSIFYVSVACLSNKQEARVLQQRRLAEVFAITSQSDPGTSLIEQSINSGLNSSEPTSANSTTVHQRLDQPSSSHSHGLN